MPSDSWERFFDAHAPRYLDEPFTSATNAEVDFLVAELRLPRGATILDVGCGVGRHAVELARLGYRVTGIDLSAGMLAQAATRADAAGVEIDLVHADATKYVAPRPFDAAICLCEGALTLLGEGSDPDEHDRSILRNVHDSLVPAGPLILTVLNAYRAIREATEDDVATGRFDPVGLILTSEMETEGRDGPVRVTVRERPYVPRELARLVADCGFRVEHLLGGTAGDWGHRQVRLDEWEIMVVARREA